MKKNGKALEQLVRLIQEALKEQQNTTIISNQKIKASNGVLREIDVLVRSEINGMEIVIAIECKDYSRPVGVEKMDSFKAKCDSISSINKKIFVSTSGYTVGAIKNAELYGIATYTVSELDKESIFTWFPPISGLNLKFEINQISCRFNEKNTKFDVANPAPFLYDADGNTLFDVLEKINGIVEQNYHLLWEQALAAFIEDQDRILTEGIINSYEIFLPNISYIKSSNGEKLWISSFVINLRLIIIKIEPTIENATTYGEFKKEIITKQVSMSIGSNTTADIIQVSDNHYKMNLYLDV